MTRGEVSPRSFGQIFWQIRAGIPACGSLGKEILFFLVSSIRLSKNPPPACAGRGILLDIRTMSLCRVALGHEAVLAKDRLAAFLHWSWFEGDLALRAALGTHRVMHLAGGEALLFAVGATIFATLGRAQILGGVELLFAFRERECGTAVAAGDLLISHNGKKEGYKDACFLLSGLSGTDRPTGRTLLERSVQVPCQKSTCVRYGRYGT